MKLTKFRDKSLIMGCFLANQRIQTSLEQELRDSKINFLGALVMLAIFFEDSDERLGPSRIAKTLGFSRSRISQELTQLQRKGLITRHFSDGSARDINLKQTTAGQKKSQEIIKVFSRAQVQIDNILGEKNAEDLNEDLMQVTRKFIVK